MAEYTKGEWVITRDKKRGYIAVRSIDDTPVCHIYSIIPNAEANAQIIALSPKMYEYIELIVRQGGWIYQKDLDEAEEILAKAETA